MHSDLLLRSSCDQLCYLPPTFWTYYYLRQLCCLCYSMGYHVTTKPVQSKYTAGLWRDGSVLKTKLLTGERKWTFACAMFQALDINGKRACARRTEACKSTTTNHHLNKFHIRYAGEPYYTQETKHSFNCKQRKFR